MRVLDVVGQRDDGDEDQRGEDLPALGAGQRPGGEERAPVVGGVLQRQRAGAGLLARGREPLQHPAQHQQRGGAPADGVVRRQAADQERRDAHQQQREQQHLLPADPVAEVADEDRADRAGDVGDAERGEREHEGGGVVAGEEDRREDQGGGGAEDEEVVVLHGAAHEAGQRGLPRRPADDRLGGSGGVLHRFSSGWVSLSRCQSVVASSRRWASIRSASGSMPVISRKASTAWWTAMWPPWSVRQPAARAAFTSGVSSGR